jgi:hypothetical protein
MGRLRTVRFYSQIVGSGHRAAHKRPIILLHNRRICSRCTSCTKGTVQEGSAIVMSAPSRPSNISWARGKNVRASERVRVLR